MTFPSMLSTQHQSNSTVDSNQSEIKYQWVFNLNSANISEYNDLTFPNLQKRWQTFKQRGKLLGVAAFAQNNMVGLVVAECIAKINTAEIISLFVEPDCRHRGIGTNLIQYLEKGLVKLECHKLQVNYKTNNITDTVLEKLLTNCGWQEPETKMVLGMGTAETMSQAPWVQKYQISSDFQIFSWQKLTAEDKEQIQTRQVEQAWYPEILSPFHPDPRLEIINSLGLRYQGKVAGWVINHRVAPDTIRYSILFVAKEIQRSGMGMVLLAESIRLQLNSSIPYGKFAVQIQNQPMLHIVRRQLSPYLVGHSESRFAQKNLISTSQK